MVNEHTDDYHPNPSELTSRTPCLKLVNFSRIVLEFFLKLVYHTMVAEKWSVSLKSIASVQK